MGEKKVGSDYSLKILRYTSSFPSVFPIVKQQQVGKLWLSRLHKN